MREDYLSLSAPVFNIQHYSIHDGPGIRVTVFLKGCPLRCLWCANPESGIARPQLMTYSGKCTGCGACVAKCPVGAISIRFEQEKHIAVTERTLCVACGVCTDSCHNDAREIVGKQMRVGDVLGKVLEDKLFLDDSGGGMTISGGECLAHPAFTQALLYAAHEAGIHTTVESCCFATRDVIDMVFPHVDLGLLDIKHMDPVLHQQYTGVSNDIILDHIQHIYHGLKVPIVIRVPVIPGYNDSDVNIRETASFVAEKLGKDVPVHLLPYHRMGESKNDALGRIMRTNIKVPDDQKMQHLKILVEEYGLFAQIGG